MAGGTTVTACTCGGAGGDDDSESCQLASRGRAPDFVVVNLGGGFPLSVPFPFVNLGTDSANAYLATGVTNAVAAKLLKTPGLRVLAPGRARSVKRRSDTASTANVDARLVLEGTVERIGDRLRVTARLSNTSDDVMRWADVFDRDVNDIFSVEDEIASAIVASIWPVAGQKGS